MARRLVGGGAAAAAAVGAGSLLLANGLSGGEGGRGVLVVLYLVFLVAALALLAGGIAWSEQWVDRMAADRASWRRRRRWRSAAKRTARRVGGAAWHGVGFAARTSRAGARQVRARLQTALTPERRRAVLIALGLDEIGERPAPGRYAAVHARRKAPPPSAITRRYNAFEARRGTRSRIERAGSG